jgi:hypothetical protein
LGVSPVIVILDPDPFVIVPPGVLVNVHIPDAGNPFNITSPVATVQVGCVIDPTPGAEGREFSDITALPVMVVVPPPFDPVIV